MTFRPATREPHVPAEGEQPFGFPLRSTVGDGEEVLVDLPLGMAQAGQQALLGLA